MLALSSLRALAAGTLLVASLVVVAPVVANASTTARISPSVECKITRPEGDFTAVFGYNSLNSANILIPVGVDNYFNPSPADRGQTTDFLPGRQYGTFGVDFASGNQVWLLKGPDGVRRSATASTSTRECSASVAARFPRPATPPSEPENP